MDLTGCTEAIIKFRDARDWRQFHTPKNLAISISLEASELLELFQWHEATILHREAREEVADVAIYLLLFCHETGIDLRQAIADKIAINEKKYPVDKARGRADKSGQL